MDYVEQRFTTWPMPCIREIDSDACAIAAASL